MNLERKQYSLILTRNFQPLDVVGVKKSMKYLCTDVGKALNPETYQLYNFDEWVETFCKEEGDISVRTEKLWIKIPEIIVLNRNCVQRKKRHSKALSKSKVFERDSHKCGYCNTSLSSKNRTIDHIIPTSRGGSNTYSNVVACCGECNSKKSDKTPEEMGWRVLHEITTPKDDSSVLKMIPRSRWLPSWETYVNA